MATRFPVLCGPLAVRRGVGALYSTALRHGRPCPVPLRGSIHRPRHARPMSLILHLCALFTPFLRSPLAIIPPSGRGSRRPPLRTPETSVIRGAPGVQPRRGMGTLELGIGRDIRPATCASLERDSSTLARPRSVKQDGALYIYWPHFTSMDSGLADTGTWEFQRPIIFPICRICTGGALTHKPLDYLMKFPRRPSYIREGPGFTTRNL